MGHDQEVSRMKMMNVSMPFHERCVLALDQYPWSVGSRMAIGFVISPLLSLLCGNEYQVWCVAGLFVGILLSLKLGCTIVRKLLPVSKEVHAIWSERRQLAKRYDSYQWQKLFGMGIGMAGHAMILGNVGNTMGLLILFCLIGGGLGVLFWIQKDESVVGLH